MPAGKPKGTEVRTRDTGIVVAKSLQAHMPSIPVLAEQPVTAADKTFVQLRADIVEGVIASGSKLSETELSTRYQVSRALIREATGVNFNNPDRGLQVGYESGSWSTILSLTWLDNRHRFKRKSHKD